jgi:thioredoxin reductase (NADPH)
MKSYDAVIIGGGPAGMTAALYLLRSEIKTAMVEKLTNGGQLFMTEKIENYPGFPGGSVGSELAQLMTDQLNEWEFEGFDRYDDEVAEMELEEGGHKIKVGSEWIAAKTVIICSGAKYRHLGLEGEERLQGRGVSYCALCDGNFYRDQVVAVVGGGNSALEEALYLTRLVKKLYLIHRRAEFRAAKCYQDRCFVNPKIELVRNTVVRNILGENAVEGVLLEDVSSGEQRTIDVEGVFVFIGFEPVGGFIPEKMEKDVAGFIKTDQEMRTSVPGVYAAGDIRSKMCRQVATAVGDGATAANSAMTYLEQFNV